MPCTRIVVLKRQKYFMPNNNSFVGTQTILFKTLNGRAATLGRIYRSA